MATVTKKIATTGELRRFMADMLLDIKEGKVEEGAARNIIKMSAQLNESFYSEAKIAKLKIDAGEQMDKFGTLSID